MQSYKRRECSKRNGDSLFRLGDMSYVIKFSWKPLLNELCQKSTNSFHGLKLLFSSSGRKLMLNNMGMATALLLKAFNKHMCSPQAVISVILYSGHASKQVCGLN